MPLAQETTYKILYKKKSQSDVVVYTYNPSEAG
jgi:hypothetical protein